MIFTRNVTEALNLVAYAWGLDNLGPGDVAVVTELEHHANFVPWQQIAKRTGAEFRVIGIEDTGELRFDGLDAIAKAGRVKVVAANLVSNTLGTINPIDRLTAWAHEQGAIMVVDAAQAVPHRRVDVQALGWTSSASPRTSSAGRRAPARSTAAASCSSGCSRSRWAAR